MRLRTKHALVLVALMLVLGGVLYLSTEQFKSQVVRQEQAELDSATTLTADQIDNATRERMNYVRWFAGRPRLSNLSAAEGNLEGFLTTSNFYAAQIVAPNGTVIAFEGEIDETEAASVVGTNVSDRSYFQEVKAPPAEPVVSAPERGDNFTTVTISAQIVEATDNGTELRGILVGAIKLDVSDFFAAKEPLETANQTVEIVGATESGEELTLDPASTAFDRSLSSSATIGTTGWEVTVRRDRSQLTDRLATLRLVQGGGLVLVFVAFLLLGLWEYQTNLRQTQRLLGGFSALERGEYDHEIDLDSAEEWRQMSDGFNQLASGLERRERQIREREQQLSVVNRVLRHNLKNEMTVIQGHAELLPTLDDPERREDTKETIKSTAGRLLSHSKKARHLSHAIESAEEGTQPIDCGSVVEQSVGPIAEEYPEFDVEIDVPTDVSVSAITSLQYAIESIVENAFQHNDSDDPWVRVAAEVTQGTVELSVADNGPGIPAHEIDVLGEDTETGLEHGSGVGLWLAYWIVKRSDGTLRFARRDPTGTVVTIELARAPEE